MNKSKSAAVKNTVNPLSDKQLKKLTKALKKSNRRAQQRNQLLTEQQQQAKLDFELAERRYLIEKSALQPTFRLFVTEFLTCEPDFVNDPEQASEAKFLADHGVGQDQRALRIKVEAKGGAAYMRPSLVIKQVKEKAHDERIYSMSELIYFIDASSLDLGSSSQSTVAYFVYRDRTTLLVILKYKLVQRSDSALLRWDATHLDTVFADMHHASNAFITSEQCAALFEDQLG